MPIKNTTSRQQKVLSLQKGNESFVFRYEPGNEEEVLDAFIEMANDGAGNFDWFDAAVLSFQLSKNLIEEADKLLGSGSAWESAPEGLA